MAERDLPGAPLAQVQKWFLTAMTAPGGAARGVQLAGQRHGLQAPEVLKDAARLHIYADGYVLRLLECLQADYPRAAPRDGRRAVRLFCPCLHLAPSVRLHHLV
ncbi:putative DNA-binding domain-containing protein [Janthinobacterium sp. AD80]|uniref:putative DNA-binding domain-containing protein n=1 Tax=Janthinobacterium sp. AD80 TaxID=1528773 RepID=UPI000C823E2F|nr:putative DNA-binding domain-containing protein [Janthinobacterium sp. AD80]PMQ14470.1 hypothetical protein JaAD80_20945 [Janthinobacterium sp. AD80]